MKETIKVGGNIRMIAHRGLSGIERENTCAAFVAAGNRSYYGIETDIHRTVDGRYIVIHDDDTERVAGVKMGVEESDFASLRALTLCDLEGHLRADLVFPELREYIRICRTYGKESVLEIKNHFEPEDIEAVLRILTEEAWLEHTILISFDLANMVCIREKCQNQRCQFLVETFDESVLNVLKQYRLDLDIDYQAVTPDVVTACHGIGAEVNVWTVNTEADAQRMRACGVDYITSNILE